MASITTDDNGVKYLISDKKVRADYYKKQWLLPDGRPLYKDIPSIDPCAMSLLRQVRRRQKGRQQQCLSLEDFKQQLLMPMLSSLERVNHSRLSTLSEVNDRSLRMAENMSARSLLLAEKLSGPGAPSLGSLPKIDPAPTNTTYDEDDRQKLLKRKIVSP